MAGLTYESDAIRIMVYDLKTKETTTLLKAEEDFEHSPYMLDWSKDMQSNQALCSIDAATSVKGGRITVHTTEASLLVQGEINNEGDERQFYAFQHGDHLQNRAGQTGRDHLQGCQGRGHPGLAHLPRWFDS